MTGGGIYEYFKNGIGRLPIRQIDFTNPSEYSMHEGIVQKVERMLTLQKQHQQAERELDDARFSLEPKIQKLDAEIDALVYRLYGLTEDEIRIVEGR